MKHVILYTLLSVVSMHSLSAATNKKPKLLLLDTAGKQAYYYRNIRALAHSVGFKTNYKNLYQLIENPHIDNKYDMIMCMLSSSFLSNLNNPITQKIVQTLIQTSKKPDKTIGLLFPDLRYSAHKNIITNILSLFDIPNNKTISSGLRTIFSHVRRTYDTTLFTKQSSLKQTKHPLEFIIKRPNNKNSFFIGKTSSFNFADIEENFRKTPINSTLKTRMLKTAQKTLYRLYKTTQKDISIQKKSDHPLPEYLSSNFIENQKKYYDKQISSLFSDNYKWIQKNGISSAWLDPDDYFGSGDKLKKITNTKKSLQSGIQFLYNAQFNLLWFEFLPEAYLHRAGLKKNQKTEYISQVKMIARELKKQWSATNKLLPKIFVGMNITTNYAHNPVRHPIKDMYGKVYNKIPCPLDKNMWKTQVVDIFHTFCKTFKQELPIDGVFLDFEMYHAQKQAGSYTDLMIFSDPAWHAYCNHIKNKHLHSITHVKNRITYLQQHKQLTAYIHFLEQEAQHIGTWLKTEFKKTIPNIMIGAYAPTLPNSWFYRGILKGLSSADKPILYTTFNTDYYSHHNWLTKQHIYLLHGAPIMLSKLKKEKDFNLIPYLKKQHYFLWYNRPSRMTYQYSDKELQQVFWGIEASPLKQDTVAKNIKLYESK